MNWYKLAQKKIFVGDCVSILDDRQFVCADATELAIMVENSIDIDRGIFLSMCEVVQDIDLGEYKFGYNKEMNIAWAHELREDIHYFYQ